MAGIDHYYAALGLTPSASAREIKQAHRDLVRQWHPDKFAGDPSLQAKATERLKDINEAYKALIRNHRSELFATVAGPNRGPQRSPRAPVEYADTARRGDATHARAAGRSRRTVSFNPFLVFLG